MTGGEGRLGNVITNPEGEHGGMSVGLECDHVGPGLPPPATAPGQGSPHLTHQQKRPNLLQRPCMYLASFVKSLPVLFISGIVGWSYYAYVIALLLYAMEDYPVEQIFCGIVYHYLFIMFFWSYGMTIFTPPGRVPESWHLNVHATAALAAAKSEDEWKVTLASVATKMNCQTKQRSVQGAVRYCEKCECIKPDRCHHCSVCEACILKMDHHCPWVNNCVGFANYKFFMLFLCYALLYCIFISATSVKYFARFWSDSQSLGSAKYHIIFVFLVSILFCISIFSLFWYHVYLVTQNRSTLEQFRAPVFEDQASDKEGWSLGSLNNFKEVFGLNPLLWPFPISTSIGDGINFPHRRAKQFTNYHSIDNRVADTPTRTLVNPILSGAGIVSTSQTIHSHSSSVQQSGKISALSGTVSPLSATEVVLDTNGHTKTLSVHPSSGGPSDVIVQ